MAVQSGNCFLQPKSNEALTLRRQLDNPTSLQNVSALRLPSTPHQAGAFLFAPYYHPGAEPGQSHGLFFWDPLLEERNASRIRW
jgi:hypothetical protein